MKILISAFLFCVAIVPAYADAYETANAPFLPKEKKMATSPTPAHLTHALLVDAELMGKSCKMLVDTGASHTVFDEAFVKKNFPQAKISQIQAAGGNIAGTFPIFSISELRIGGNVFKDFSAVAYDLSGLRFALAEKNLQGVLGMNLMTLAPFSLSYKSKTLRWLSTEDVQKIADKKELFAKIDPESAMFTIELISPKDGKKIQALLDCGSTGTFVPADFWIGAQKKKAFAKVTSAHATEKLTSLTFGMPATLKLGEDFELKKVTPTLINPSEHPILLGGDVLAHFDLIIDRKAGKIYAAPVK